MIARREHLVKLLEGGLVTVDSQGRHRYHRIHDPEVAALLEGLFQVSPRQAAVIKRASAVPTELAYARSCYDHLAGTVAVALTDHLADIGAIDYHDTVPQLTDEGRRIVEAIGIGILAADTNEQRPMLRRCLNWSERRHHLGGALPAALLDHMLSERWCTRRHHGRSLRITDTAGSNSAPRSGSTRMPDLEHN